MKLWDIIRICVCIASCGVLWWAAGRSEKIKSPKWRRLWLFAPLLALPIDKLGPELSMIPLYIGSSASLCRKSRRSAHSRSRGRFAWR